jgi:hypothetical protein
MRWEYGYGDDAGFETCQECNYEFEGRKKDQDGSIGIIS